MMPHFIVIEALDGVGKTTLTTTLAQRLGAVATNTPGDTLREVSGRVLQGLGPNQEARCLFYAASVLAAGGRALKLVEGGVSVVMDRYWLSTIAYARARGVTESFREIEALVPTPDLTVLLTLDESARRARLGGRGLTSADRETLDPTFRERVLREMCSDERAMGLRPTLVLDVGLRSPAALVDEIVAHLHGVAAK